MGRVIRIFALILVVSTVLLSLDYFRVKTRERRVSDAVSRLGGQMGSLPFWPFGTEYRVSFRRTLNEDELDSLVELNALRGHVDVRFSQCDLSKTQQELICHKLASCFVLLDNGDTVVRLNGP